MPGPQIPLEDMTPIEAKADLQHAELGGEHVGDASKTDVPLETAFVGMSKWQAMRKFWRASLFCFMAAFAALLDGFQFSIPGKSHIQARFYICADSV